MALNLFSFRCCCCPCTPLDGGSAATVTKEGLVNPACGLTSCSVLTRFQGLESVSFLDKDDDEVVLVVVLMLVVVVMVLVVLVVNALLCLLKQG